MANIYKNPVFSILIANYNNAKYLLDAINSVFAQTYKNWEIIIVDDGSTDNSRELYKALENNSRIKIFYNSCNKGCAFTKRRCIELASGEICGFLDPDDTISVDALSIMIKSHNENPEASIIYSTHYITDETLNIIGRGKLVGLIKIGESHLNTSRYGISHFATFRKQKYNKTSGIDPNYKRAVDQDLYYKLEELGPVIFIDKPLYYYRINSNGISVGKNEIKAHYWNLVIKKAAFKRRKSNKTCAANITKHNLDKAFLRYYIRKAASKAHSHEWQKMYYCLCKALPYIMHDSKLSVLRYALIPIKLKIGFAKNYIKTA
jgi:glycosyltransferase involved in cell wall biosynthesis